MARSPRFKFGKKASIVPFTVLTILLILATLLSIFGWTTPLRDREGRRIRIKGAKEMRFGIDIRGGVEAVFAPKDFEGKPTAEQLDSAAKVLNFRLDSLQILDRELTTSPSSGRIIVRFPWKSDETDFRPDEALKELGEMAYLSFRTDDGRTVLDGSMVESAQAVFDPHTNLPVVSLSLDNKGAELFASITEELAGTGRPLMIFLDDKIISSPTVQDRIDGGQAIISSPTMTKEEAFDLAQKINGGALPFAMEAISSSSLSPKLGQNSLRLMIQAGALAFIIICIYMIVMYRLPGVVACLSLTAQVVGVLLAISIPQQTLTLQGIAGIILSIGMGVDANIIIASRIREEARKGLTLQGFLYNGFTKAFSSVMDSNVTVAIAAIVLMIFGSGTILSFAYSLLAGVILNGITGVWMTRSMIASLSSIPALQDPWLYGAKKGQDNSGRGSEMEDTRPAKIYPFIEKRKLFLGLAVVLIVVGFGIALARGFDLDIEFKGGSMVDYSFTGDIDDGLAEQTLTDVLAEPVTCQISKAIGSDEQVLKVSIASNEALTPDELSKVTEALNTMAPEANFEISSANLVSPSIGREMLRNGLLALVIASFLIIGYVWFSFRKMSGPSAGVMALVALLHDIVLAVLAFVIMGSAINETLIAVVLTILGFSINDTIVIYDRVRENMLKYSEEMTFNQIIDLSITQSLGRTINTSLCIFIAVVIAYVFAIMYNLESIKEFALPILVGVISGTFSSITIATPLWSIWKTRQGRTGLEEVN